METNILAPGARVVTRDAEWIVRRVDHASDGGQELVCDGISELVREQTAIFLTSIDRDIQVLDPADTALVSDTSSGYQASLLYMESLLRQVAPSNAQIHIGHQAAMDLVPYQLDPASQALQQPRQRILIADAVGLGKTLEAGVLVSDPSRSLSGYAGKGAIFQSGRLPPVCAGTDSAARTAGPGGSVHRRDQRTRPA